MWPNPQFSTDLVTFTEKIYNKKLHFCAVLRPVSSGFECRNSLKQIYSIIISIFEIAFCFVKKLSWIQTNSCSTWNFQSFKNLKRNTCDGVFFDVGRCKPAIVLKKDSIAGFAMSLLQIFKKAVL